MSMTELEARNIMLRAIHHTPAQIADEADLKYALAGTTLRQERRALLGAGFSFNTDTITLTFNSERGLIPVPSTYLKIRNLPDDLEIRDGGIWDTANNEYYSQTLDKMEVAIDIEISKMPEAFANWIAHSAASRYYEDVMDETAGWLEKRARKFWAIAINSEDPSIKKASGISAVRAAHTGGL